jgi:hypothetical protein
MVGKFVAQLCEDGVDGVVFGGDFEGLFINLI